MILSDLYSDYLYIMLKNFINIAQKLGEKIGNNDFHIDVKSFFDGKVDINLYSVIKFSTYKNIQNVLPPWYNILRSFQDTDQQLIFITDGNKNSINFYILAPRSQLTYLESIIYANLPDIDIQLSDNKFESPNYIDLGLNELMNDQDFIKNGKYLDPFIDILSLYEDVKDKLTFYYMVKFDKSKSLMEKTIDTFKQATSTLTDMWFKKEDKKDLPNWLDEDSNIVVKFACGYYSYDHANTSKVKSQIKSIYSKFLKKWSIKFVSKPVFVKAALNQVINFFHPIGSEQHVGGVHFNSHRKLPFPANLPTLENTTDRNDLTVIGITDYRNKNIRFGIKREDKLRHIYIIWKTWVGKSKLIANLARSDMISNKWICVIDPHGDLIDDVISQVPSYRINDVVLFDVSDRDWPIWFNILECENKEQKPLIASSVVSIFKKMFGNSRWPRLEYILRNVIFSLLDYPNANFLHLVRMLTDNDFKEEVLTYVTDPIILKFWRDEYDRYQPKQREEAISPITNKVWQFTSSTIVRNIFGQSKTKINLRRMMDEGKIILVNLSKGKIWEDSTNMIWSFIVSKLQIDAMSRADISESERKDFYLYIDEFQNFSTESFATILSEARKYKLWLVVANQFSTQLDEVIRDAIFGNVWTIISMTIGYDDALIMSNQFKSMVTANDFLDLPKYNAYTKLMIDGVVSDPFNMKTLPLPLWEDVEALKEKIRAQSRQRYAISKSELEQLIQVRSTRKFSKTEKKIEEARAKLGNKIVEIWSDKKIPDSFIKTPIVKKSDNNTSTSSKVSTTNPNIDLIPKDKDIIWLFDFEIGGRHPDQILYDKEKHDHKYIFFEIPGGLDDIAKLDLAKPKWEYYTKGERKIYKVYLDMYLHESLKNEAEEPLKIWVGNHEQVLSQVNNGFTKPTKRYLYNNPANLSLNNKNKSQDKDNQISKDTNTWPVLEDKNSIATTKDTKSDKETDKKEVNNLDDNFPIKVGKTYQWFVKLKFNYGLFVTVGDIDGLLHKSLIDTPNDLSWKKLYEIGDPIAVTASEIKEKDWVKTVSRSQI